MSSVRGCGRSIAKLSAMRAGPAVKRPRGVPRNTASEMPCVTNRMVLPDSLPDAQQLEVHLLAGQRVERAERLVHQHQLRVVDQRACDRRALLHAARQLVRPLVLRACEADQREQVARAPRRSSIGRPRISAGSMTLSRIVRHFSSSGCWNTMPMSRAGSNGSFAEPTSPCRRRADAGRRGSSAACSCRSRTGRPGRRARPA